MHKFYECLGVERGASKDEIKRAYKKLAVMHHPDKGGDPEEFKALSEAYAVLSDDEQRSRYDAVGDGGWAAGAGAGAQASQPFDPSSIFADLFGGMGMGGMGGMGARPRGPQKCRDHKHLLSISLEDAYSGTQKTLKVSLPKTCARCREQCYACQGVGHVTHVQRSGFMTQMMSRACDACNGSGMTTNAKKSCTSCGGKGAWSEDNKIEINLPPGVSTGFTQVFPGLGEQPKRDNQVPGDLHLEVLVVSDKNFERDGDHLMRTVPITWADSILGAQVTFAMPDGGTFSLDTFKEIGIVHPGEVYRVVGKGMPKTRGSNGSSSSRGDLMLTFKVSYPKMKTSDLQSADYEALSQIIKRIV
jgi:DnaJ family protein A protein 2